MKRLYHENMTKMERHIAENIVKNRMNIEKMSIGELASFCNVSVAMISKYSQNCGFTGFKELKYYVKESYSVGVEIRTDSIESKINDYFQNFELENLLTLKSYCDKMENIIIYGCGASYEAGKYFVPRLRMAFGKSVYCENDYQQLQSEFFITGTKLLIVLSASGKTPDVLKIIKEAGQKNIVTVVITESYCSEITTMCTFYISLLNNQEEKSYEMVRGRTLFFLYLETLVQSKINQEANI